MDPVQISTLEKHVAELASELASASDAWHSASDAEAHARSLRIALDLSTELAIAVNSLHAAEDDARALTPGPTTQLN